MDVQYLLANRPAFIYPVDVGADPHSGYSCTSVCPNNIVTAAKQCHLSTLSPPVSLSFVTFSMPVPKKGSPDTVWWKRMRLRYRFIGHS